MKKALLEVLLLFPFCINAQTNWQIQPVQIQTRWAKEVSPTNALPEYPRPQMVRKEWANLNGLWQFASGDEVKEAPIGRDLKGQILVPFCMESALSGVGKHFDRAWYRRNVKVPDEWKEKHVLL